MTHTYTCPVCELTSRPVATAIEATYLAQIHRTVQHTSVLRAEPPRPITVPAPAGAAA